MKDQLLTIPQVAEMLACSRSHVYRMIAAGRLPTPVKIGRASRISARQLDAVLSKLVA